MVAQLAHISSEDWTRTYRFQHVVWPNDDNLNDDDDTVLAICRAAVQDVLAAGSISSRNVVALGHAGQKSQTLFGSMATRSVAHVFAQKNKSPDDVADQDIVERYGLLGWTVRALLEEQQKQPQGAVCTLSVLEVADDDALYDLLAVQTFCQVRHLEFR